jgi:hypothetical protein
MHITAIACSCNASQAGQRCINVRDYDYKACASSQVQGQWRLDCQVHISAKWLIDCSFLRARMLVIHMRLNTSSQAARCNKTVMHRELIADVANM